MVEAECVPDAVDGEGVGEVIEWRGVVAWAVAVASVRASMVESGIGESTVSLPSFDEVVLSSNVLSSSVSLSSELSGKVRGVM